jgi:hypothetical protein
MAVALAQYSLPTKGGQLAWPLRASLLDVISATSQQARDQIDLRGLIGMAAEQSSSTIEFPVTSHVLKLPITPFDDDTLDRDLGFEIAYHALADRRGVNATPAGRTGSRKVWLNAGADAAQWLIDRLRTEQHPETIIGIAETITELGAVALLIALAELERYEAKPEYAALVEALAWMTPPSQPLLVARIAGIVDRYLASPHIDCQVAAVQLTRILDDNAARTRLDAAKKNAGQRLREEIEDLLNERFGE